MTLLVILFALFLLMFVAYQGYSVILFAPLVAMLAVLLTQPDAVPVMFTGVFMEKTVSFLKLYFPIFMLGAIFGKMFEISGFSKSIVNFIVKFLGPNNAILAIVLVSSLLTYGGVSLFVVVFAVYPFAADLFKKSNIPKRLVPAAIALGAFTFTMDALPGSPQIQNIIPTTFFKTDAWASPVLGIMGAVFVLIFGLIYINWQKRKSNAAGEGYGENHLNEPQEIDTDKLPSFWIAILPLILVVGLNKYFVPLINVHFGETAQTQLESMDHAVSVAVSGVASIWAIIAALLVGILSIFIMAFKTVYPKFVDGSKAAVGGALIASLNTASEYGFGAIIAALPGFLLVKQSLQNIPNVLVNEAVTVTTLAGITGSASGGLSIALAAMSESFIKLADSAHVPLEVLHRIASMASGGMDTLPHNGAVITLLAVSGLTHRQSYKDIFVITCLKTLAVFFVISVYYTTGLI
ncbi:MAG: GntP family permease [Pseudobdellovibrio sp.]